MGRDLITLCLEAATSPPPHRCLPHHRLTAARHLLPLSSSFSPLSFFSFSIGILALPAVTAQSGFAASSAALLGGWMFSVGEDGPWAAGCCIPPGHSRPVAADLPATSHREWCSHGPPPS